VAKQTDTVKHVSKGFAENMSRLMQEDRAARPEGSGSEMPLDGELARRFSDDSIATDAQVLAEDPMTMMHGASSLDMHEVLARNLGLEYVDLDDYQTVDLKVLRMLSADQAKAFKVFPLSFDGPSQTLKLAIANPSDPTIVDNLRLILGCDIDAVVASEDAILDRINRQYGVGDESIESILEEVRGEDGDDILGSDQSGRQIDLSDVNQVVNLPPIIRLTNLVLMKAIQDSASDIHIEPFQSILRIRYRVDGVLREMESPPASMKLGLVSRLKVMANLDIAETRRPQDGRIKLILPGQREVDLRVTSAPTVHGESIVMRVLDRSVMEIGIHQLGMSQNILESFLKDVQKPNGIVLVTGPTGCGKTTTLYSAIKEVKTPTEKLITTEDPVEYQVDGIIQVNINESVGLTYARCLRAILRQDPERILVGEIRDVETARIAIESALTGHLVFSTLHTNSAAGTVTRLIDMGIEPYLITSTLQSVIGQRLVRMTCGNCRLPYIPSDEELMEFRQTRESVSDIPFQIGDGCDDCAFTGYHGRIGVFEYLKNSEEMSDLCLGGGTTDEIQELAIKQGMATIRQDGWLKVCMGLTTFHEIIAHTPPDTEANNPGAAV
jgi:type IV pilus assembly protein PilB